MNWREPEEHLGERRTSMRFDIQAPAIATIGSREIWAFTRDISTHAIYLRIDGDDEKLSTGQELDFVIKIMPSMNFSEPRFIKGRGRTIRIDDLEGNETGIVVQILDYRIESPAVHEGANDHSRSGA